VEIQDATWFSIFAKGAVLWVALNSLLTNALNAAVDGRPLVHSVANRWKSLGAPVFLTAQVAA
jgi:hypothetical protein